MAAEEDSEEDSEACRGVVGIWSASSITPTLPKSVRASQTGWLLQRSMSAVGATRSCV